MLAYKCRFCVHQKAFQCWCCWLDHRKVFSLKYREVKVSSHRCLLDSYEVVESVYQFREDHQVIGCAKLVEETIEFIWLPHELPAFRIQNLLAKQDLLVFDQGSRFQSLITVAENLEKQPPHLLACRYALEYKGLGSFQ